MGSYSSQTDEFAGPAAPPGQPKDIQVSLNLAAPKKSSSMASLVEAHVELSSTSPSLTLSLAPPTAGLASNIPEHAFARETTSLAQQQGPFDRLQEHQDREGQERQQQQQEPQSLLGLFTPASQMETRQTAAAGGRGAGAAAQAEPRAQASAKFTSSLEAPRALPLTPAAETAPENHNPLALAAEPRAKATPHTEESTAALRMLLGFRGRTPAGPSFGPAGGVAQDSPETSERNLWPRDAQSPWAPLLQGSPETLQSFQAQGDATGQASATLPSIKQLLGQRGTPCLAAPEAHLPGTGGDGHGSGSLSRFGRDSVVKETTRKEPAAGALALVHGHQAPDPGSGAGLGPASRSWAGQGVPCPSGVGQGMEFVIRAPQGRIFQLQDLAPGSAARLSQLPQKLQDDVLGFTLPQHWGPQLLSSGNEQSSADPPGETAQGEPLPCEAPPLTPDMALRHDPQSQALQLFLLDYQSRMHVRSQLREGVGDDVVQPGTLSTAPSLLGGQAAVFGGQRTGLGGGQRTEFGGGIGSLSAQGFAGTLPAAGRPSVSLESKGRRLLGDPKAPELGHTLGTFPWHSQGAQEHLPGSFQGNVQGSLPGSLSEVSSGWRSALGQRRSDDMAQASSDLEGTVPSSLAQLVSQEQLRAQGASEGQGLASMPGDQALMEEGQRPGPGIVPGLIHGNSLLHIQNETQAPQSAQNDSHSVLESIQPFNNWILSSSKLDFNLEQRHGVLTQTETMGDRAFLPTAAVEHAYVSQGASEHTESQKQHIQNSVSARMSAGSLDPSFLPTTRDTAALAGASPGPAWAGAGWAGAGPTPAKAVPRSAGPSPPRASWTSSYSQAAPSGPGSAKSWDLGPSSQAGTSTSPVGPAGRRSWGTAAAAVPRAPVGSQDGGPSWGSPASSTAGAEDKVMERMSCAASSTAPAVPETSPLRRPWAAGSGNYPCQVCGMRFPSAQALGGHQNAHKELRGENFPKPKRKKRKRKESPATEALEEGAEGIESDQVGEIFESLLVGEAQAMSSPDPIQSNLQPCEKGTEVEMSTAVAQDMKTIKEKGAYHEFFL